MKKILVTLCTVGLMGTAAFPGTKAVPTKNTKSAGVYCEYTLNVYDSNGNYLSSETSLSYQGSGSCGRFFKMMRSYYASLGYQF